MSTRQQGNIRCAESTPLKTGVYGGKRMIEHIVSSLGTHVHFDALLAAEGTRGADGSVSITDLIGRHNIDPAFIDNYPNVAKEDVVGQLFAACPRIVQTISVADYRDLGKRESDYAPGARGGKLIGDYLERFGIRHLMLAGLESSFGLAWMTIYRTGLDDPFSHQDAEWARYLVPAILFQWQHQTKAKKHVGISTRLLPLTPREMQIAVLNVQGLHPKEISKRLTVSTYYIQDVIKNVRRRLKIAARKMTMDDLERY